jgi:hypothetical protein
MLLRLDDRFHPGRTQQVDPEESFAVLFSAPRSCRSDPHTGRHGAVELVGEKLLPLLKIKYNSAIADAFADLGKPEQVRKYSWASKSTCTRGSLAVRPGNA